MLGALLTKRATRLAFDALNRHDLQALLNNYAPDVVFEYPGTVGPCGTHRGKDAVRALLERIFQQFPVIDFRVRTIALANPLDMLGNNVVYTHWDVSLTNRDAIRAEFGGITVATVRKGKVVLIQDIFDASSEQHQRSWRGMAGSTWGARFPSQEKPSGN